MNVHKYILVPKSGVITYTVYEILILTCLGNYGCNKFSERNIKTKTYYSYLRPYNSMKNLEKKEFY